MALRTPAFNDAKTYGFEWVRAAGIEAMLQEGVLNFGAAGTDFKVTAAAGGGMKVDLAAGAALVKGDSGVPATGLSQGLFFAINDAAIANAATLTAAHATLPRIDQIVLRIRDSADLGTAADDAAIIVVTGAATSGATLDNRTGAAALPNDCLRLADVLVPAASVAVTAANVRDRRPWARGAFAAIVRGSGSYTTTASTIGDIDATNLAPRVECSGAPVRLSLKGLFAYTAAVPFTQWALAQDGVKVAGEDIGAAAANSQTALVVEGVIAPAPGSHVFKPQFAVNTGTPGTLTAYAAGPTGNALVFTVEELVRPNAQNT